jgi:hypothetical protein
VKGFSAMTVTSFDNGGALMSPRTVRYVEALVREGNNFDHRKWLQQVREEEAQAKYPPLASAAGDSAPIQIKAPISTSNFLHGSSQSAVTKAVSVRGAIWRLRHEPRGNRPERWLEKVRGAGDKFQSSRRRDAVYGYLEEVFAIVAHYRVRRRTNNLLRHAFEFADQPLDKHADPFTAVIRCTCDGQADNKTISKWARALRYVARCKKPGTPLKAFMTEAGGVNACAASYAKHFGRGGQ